MDAKKTIEQAVRAFRSGHGNQGVELLRKVLKYQPTNQQAVQVLAQVQQQATRAVVPVDMLRHVAEAQPQNPLVHELLANYLMNSDAPAAEQSARAALRINPNSAPTHCLLAATLVAQRRLPEAADAYRAAIRLRPGDSFPIIRLAEVMTRGGRANDAVNLLRNASAAMPKNAELRHALGSLLFQLDRADEAEAALRESIALKADYIPGYGTLGMLLQRAGRHAEAEELVRRALTLQPDIAMLHLSLGHVMVDLGRLPEAEAAFRRALELDGRMVAAAVSLSSLQWLQGKPFEALEIARRAVQAAPGFAEAHHALGTALHAIGRNEEAVQALLQSWQRAGKASSGSNLQHASNYVTNMTPQKVSQAHRAWAQRHAENIPAVFAHGNDRDPERRLKVGYLSPDFRVHAVSHFIEPLLMGHDRVRVEVYCYSAVGLPDAVTERLKSRADQWREINTLTDQKAAELVHADGIDVLVDLAGHTNQNRLLVMARRPAPVQVTYQGYPNTTGLSAIAYRLTDAHADPPGDGDALYTERLVRLPRTAWCYRPPEPAPDVTDLPAHRTGRFTFGSFNRLAKVSPTTAEVWSRAVNAVPGARLVFKTAGLNEPSTEKYVREMFARYGLEGERLVLLGSDPSPQAHLERYGEVDVALDCFPYHGTTTSCEAMWMGVPSIVLVGPTHVSRVGLSLLTNVGLPEFAATSADQFVETATNAAKDLDRLAELRRTMRDRMRSSPLMDVAGFCREVEDAYRQMWRTWCSSAPVDAAAPAPTAVAVAPEQ